MQLERRRQDEIYTNNHNTRTATTTSGSQSLGPAPLPPDFSDFRIQQQTQLREQATNGHDQESSSSSLSAAQLNASQDLLVSLSVAQDTFVNVLHQLVRSNLPGTSSATASGSISGLETSKGHTSSNGVEGTASRTQQDERLASLLHDLRQASELLHDPFSRGEMQQVSHATMEDSSTTIHEVKQSLDKLAPQFSDTKPEARQTARTLASLLGCLDRLKTLYEASPTLASSTEMDGDHDSSVAASAPAKLQGIGSETAVYESLQREAKSRQYSSARMARNDSHDSANAVRAVEEAEAELLWGRVDDLLELLSDLRASSAASQTVKNGTREHRKGADYTLVGPTPAMANDEPTFTAQNMLPEYSSLDPPEYAVEGDLEYPIDGKDSLEDGTPRRLQRVTIRQRYPTDEKMQMDLDRMTSAIERLYTASPQLANQRVDTVRPLALDRAALREAQLARLGSAIERLNKGRLEDQRATLSPNQTVNGKESTGLFGFLSSSGTITANGKGKAVETKQQSLDKLLNDIDKAASRTMNDQRVSISARQRDAISSARQTAQAAAQDLRSLDREELAFREHLLDSVSKGRLTGQDAVFTLSSSSSAQARSSAPPNVSSFGSRLVTQRRSVAHPLDYNLYSNPNNSSNARARASSVGGIPPVPPMPVEYSSSKSGKEKEPTVKKRFSVSRLLSAKDGNSLQTSRNKSGSRPTSMHASDMVAMHYVVEEMRNLGSLIVRVWDDRFDRNDGASESSLAQEAWSAKCLDSTTLQLATNHESATIRLASPTSQDTLSTKSLDFVFKSDHFELRLPTADSTHSTRSREDLEIATPYRASVFKKYNPASLVCSTCGEQIADLTPITRYNDLPSEHWAELLDAWMCHHDQTLSEELVAKGNNIWPKAHQALLSSGAIVLAAENVRSWQVADDIEATLGADGHWKSVRCQACRSLIGKSSTGPRQDPSAAPAYIRLFKYAIQPASRYRMPVQPLSAHVTSAILETSLAMAIHRFVIEDAEQSVVRLVLWLFNPSIRISSSNTSLSNAPTINAVKILYRVGNDLDQAAIADLMGNIEYETLSYSSRICSQISDLLELSTHIYPRSQQRLGEWNVGWLQRSTEVE